MTKEPHSEPSARAPDDLVLAGLQLTSAVAHGRRAVARSRRLPGLSLLFVAIGRGQMKTRPAWIPALPWSTGLAPDLPWGWGARAEPSASSPVERVGAPLVSLAPPGLPARGALDPFAARRIDVEEGRRRVGDAPVSATPAALVERAAPPLGLQSGEPRSGDPSVTARERAARSLEGGALPLVSRASTAQTEALRSGMTPAPRELPRLPEREPRAPLVVQRVTVPVEALESARPPTRSDLATAPDPATPGAGLSLESSPPSAPFRAGLSLEVVAPGLVLFRGPLAAPTRPFSAGSSASADPTASTVVNAAHPRLRAGSVFGLDLAAARRVVAAPTRELRDAPSASAPVDASAISAGRRDVASEPHPEAATIGALPWSTSTSQTAASRAPASISAPRVAGASAWRAPPSDAGTPELTGPDAPAAARRLPQRAAHAAPEAVRNVLEVTDALRAFVADEIREVKEGMARVAARRPEAAPTPTPTPSDDTVRQLLRRMRAMMQEERFRSGKLR